MKEDDLMKKRLLSLFLALVMLVSLIPTTAFAWDDGNSGSVSITKVDVNGDQITVTMDMDTTVESSLVFAGYSESGKLLVSAAYEIPASHVQGQIFDLPCVGLSDVGSLATVKVFPEPVTPSRVLCLEPCRIEPTSCAIASGWSPIGA